MSVILKAGDILLMPSDYTEGGKYLEETFGEGVYDFLKAVTGQKYLHAELYVGYGYIFAAWTNGVHLYPARAVHFNYFDIFRHKDPTVNEMIHKVIQREFEKAKKGEGEYFNKPYDTRSLFLNGIAEILGVFNLEKWFEDEIALNTPQQFICSELIARIYQKAGYPICEKPEWCSPQDIADSPVLYKVL